MENTGKLKITWRQESEGGISFELLVIIAVCLSLQLAARKCSFRLPPAARKPKLLLLTAYRPLPFRGHNVG